MEVTEQLVDKLAHLSRLRFSKDEKVTIQNDLQNMIGFVEKLNEIDTMGVKPLLHIGEANNVFRADELKGSVTREAALSNAPIVGAQFFKVPKVIKK
jgi:aspartyl-tRNA(Asn)/glutamyl-tRNA(Gln) amidotransferase subunit C